MSIIKQLSRDWKITLYNSRSDRWSTDETEINIYDYSTYRPGWNTSDFDKSDFVFTYSADGDEYIFCYRDMGNVETENYGLLSAWTVLKFPFFTADCSTCSGKNRSSYSAYIVDTFEEIGRYVFTSNQFDCMFGRDAKTKGSFFNVRNACTSYDDTIFTELPNVLKWSSEYIYDLMYGSYSFHLTYRQFAVINNRKMWSDSPVKYIGTISEDILYHEICLGWLNLDDLIRIKTLNKKFNGMVENYIKSYMQDNYVNVIEHTFDKTIEYAYSGLDHILLIDDFCVAQHSLNISLSVFYEGKLVIHAKFSYDCYTQDINYVDGIISVKDDTGLYCDRFVKDIEEGIYGSYTIIDDEIYIIDIDQKIYFLGNITKTLNV